MAIHELPLQIAPKKKGAASWNITIRDTLEYQKITAYIRNKFKNCHKDKFNDSPRQ